MITSRRIMWARYVASNGEKIKAYRTLVRKPARQRTLERQE
jgi:hypothetical protein